MTTPAPAPAPDPGLDAVLQRLETVIGKLADGSAPLDDLVAAHEEATRLVDAAQARLRALMSDLEPKAE